MGSPVVYLACPNNIAALLMKALIRQFSPAYFAMVMSTGIISLAAHALHLEWLANSFLYLNLVLYPLFVGALLLRLLLFPRAFWQALTSHEQGAGFLALVPATTLLGSQLVQLRGQHFLGSMLWGIAAGCWALLLYAFLWGISTKPLKPTLERGFSGRWLLLVVATEALAVLGAKLLPTSLLSTDVAIFGVLGLFLVGSWLYVVLSTLLFYRLAFVRLVGEEVGAAYWVSIGAGAITVLAGASLVRAMQHTPALADLQPFVKVYSVLFWGVCTWWLPLVFCLRLWNHWTTRPAFSYSPAYWTMVFPLGMYTAATGQLAETLPLPALKIIPEYFIFIALAAWLLTMAGMLYHLLVPAKPSLVAKPIPVEIHLSSSPVPKK